MSNWFEQQRVAWIDEMLEIYGFINREHLCRKFGISVPQASHDLKRFQESCWNVRYDMTRKAYVRDALSAKPQGRPAVADVSAPRPEGDQPAGPE